jgi:hypothetical protein
MTRNGWIARIEVESFKGIFRRIASLSRHGHESDVDLV